MIDPDLLYALAFKTELAASQRLVARAGLTPAQALLQTLTRSAGVAGLAQLVAERQAARLHAQQQASRRQALASAARSRSAAAGPNAGQNAGQDASQNASQNAGQSWRAWFDGSARPNPGRCGLGAVLEGPGGVRIELAQDGGYGNSSEAEYAALIAVLRAALEHQAHDLLVQGDSQVVIDDVNGPDSASAPALRALRSAAQALLAQLPQARLRWIPRHKNSQADALSQRAVRHFTMETTE